MPETPAPRLPDDLLGMLARVHCRGNKKRLEAVLAMSGEDGADLAELADRLGVSRQKLSYWRDRWKAEVGPALEAEGYAPPAIGSGRRTAQRTAA